MEDHKKLLSTKLQSMSESATIMMAEKARELKSQGVDVISLSLGEPDFDTPDHIKNAAKNALDEGFTKYTPVPGHLALREAISEKFKRDNQLEYGPNQIVVSNGAKQSIANLCLALLDPGQEVIILTPYWVSYFDIVKFSGGTPVALSAGIDRDFKVKAEDLDEAINDKTKMILFSSPCNPTGSVYLKSELEAISEVIKKYPNVFVISDEIYEHINFTNEHCSIGSLEGMLERTITVNGFSKGYAMTGWRLGYIGAPLWIAQACAKVQGQFTSGATSFGQMAAVAALNSDQRPSHKMKEAYLRRRDFMVKNLSAIDGIDVNNPQGAFYIFADVSGSFGRSNGKNTIETANDFAEIMLTEAHVAMVSGTAFGNKDCVRLSYAAADNILKEAVERMAKTLSSYR